MTEGIYKYRYGAVIAILAIALLVVAMTDGTTNSADVNPDAIGQDIRPDEPAAVEAETPEETKTNDGYDYDIEVRNVGYHSIDEEGYCSAICFGRTVKGVPANATILSDIKVSGEKIEFYIENTWKYLSGISPYTCTSIVNCVQNDLCNSVNTAVDKANMAQVLVN